MFESVLYENDNIKAAINEAQTAVLLHVKTKDEYSVLKGEDAARFRQHALVGNFVRQTEANLEAQKAELDAQARIQINTAISESNAYFNGFAV
ncbi:MAG: hypothetical protein INF44_02690 [Thalassospira sp.]|nr:hypothetical protein [Thalassospira sp.]